MYDHIYFRVGFHFQWLNIYDYSVEQSNANIMTIVEILKTSYKIANYPPGPFFLQILSSQWYVAVIAFWTKSTSINGRIQAGF